MKLPPWFLSGAGCGYAPRLCSVGVNGEWVVGGLVAVRVPAGMTAPSLSAFGERDAADVRRLILAAAGTLNVTVSLPFIAPGRDGDMPEHYLVMVGDQYAEMRHVALLATLYPGCTWTAPKSKHSGLVPVYAFSAERLGSLVGMVSTLYPPRPNPLVDP